MQFSLSIERFAILMKENSILLERLMTLAKLESSRELCSKVRSLFDELTQEELIAIGATGKLSSERTSELMRKTGLSAAELSLPLLLHSRYREFVDDSYSFTGEYRLSEAEITAALGQSAEVFAEFWFLLVSGTRCSVCSWSVQDGGWSSWSFDAEDLARSCIQNLLLRGKVFHSDWDVASYAMKRGWPNAKAVADRFGLRENREKTENRGQSSQV